MEFVTPVNNKNNFCLISGENHFFRYLLEVPINTILMQHTIGWGGGTLLSVMIHQTSPDR